MQRSAPPLHLVLLPGLDGTGTLFDAFRHELPSNVRSTVVRYPIDTVLDLDGLAAQVAASVPANEPYALIAESFSGAVALRHARDQPSGLSAVVLVASFLKNPLPWPMTVLRPFLGSLTFRVPPPRAFLRTFLTAGLPAGPPGEALLDTLVTAITSVRPDVLEERLRQVIKRDATSHFSHAATRLIVLIAGHDRLLGDRGASQLRQARPDAHFIEIEGPHLLLQTRPRACWIALAPLL